MFRFGDLAMWTAEHRERYEDNSRRYPGDLTDAQWAAVAPLFAGYATLTADLDETANACPCLQETGCQWRFLPKKFGPWQTAHIWHDRCNEDGVWTGVSALLIRAVRRRRGHEAEPTTASPTAIVSLPARNAAITALTATSASGGSSGMF